MIVEIAVALGNQEEFCYRKKVTIETVGNRLEAQWRGQIRFIMSCLDDPLLMLLKEKLKC